MVCPQRAAGNTFFVHEGPRRNTKNCNGNTFVHGGHGGPRRTATATATSFCPRRAAKGHEENLCQIIIWSVHEGRWGTPFLSTKGREGTRRTATATHLSTEDTEGRGELQRRLQLPFVHGGPRSATNKTFARSLFGLSTKGRGEHLFCPRRAAKDHEELQRQHICPRRTRRAAENCNGDCNFLLSTEGREVPRRKPLPDHYLVCPRRDAGNTFFVHEGPRRTTKNCNGNTFVHGGHGGPRRTATATATSFCPRRAAKCHEENLCQIIIWSVHEGTRGTPFVVDADHSRR